MEADGQQAATAGKSTPVTRKGEPKKRRAVLKRTSGTFYQSFLLFRGQISLEKMTSKLNSHCLFSASCYCWNPSLAHFLLCSFTYRNHAFALFLIVIFFMYLIATSCCNIPLSLMGLVQNSLVSMCTHIRTIHVAAYFDVKADAGNYSNLLLEY